MEKGKKGKGKGKGKREREKVRRLGGTRDYGVCCSRNDHSPAVAFSQVGGGKWQREREMKRVISAKGRVERVREGAGIGR
jgi:hypothetical protein